MNGEWINYAWDDGWDDELIDELIYD